MRTVESSAYCSVLIQLMFLSGNSLGMKPVKSTKPPKTPETLTSALPTRLAMVHYLDVRDLMNSEICPCIVRGDDYWSFRNGKLSCEDRLSGSCNIC